MDPQDNGDCCVASLLALAWGATTPRSRSATSAAL